MEALRQMLAVVVVFALLGLGIWGLGLWGLAQRGPALWKVRRAGIPGSRPPGSKAASGGPAGWWRIASGFERGRAPAFERPLERMERLALTPQHMLHLVRIQGREWVVATHPQGCAFLSSGLPEGISPGGAERAAAASPAGMVS
jgi:hypothetical protein